MASFDINNLEERLRARNQFDGNLRYGAGTFHAKTNRSGVGRPSSGYLIREHAQVVTDTGIDRYQRVEDVWESVDQCPVCGSPERGLFLTRFGLDIYRCQQCAHRYLNPRLKFDVLVKLYADDKTASDIYTQPLQIGIDQIKYQYGLDLIEQLDPPAQERIMDIGCGAGVFLKLAHQKGWRQCVGIDVNERYADIYREAAGVQFISATFESLNPDELGSHYDCISVWNVLEHIYDVHGLLDVLTRLLKSGGLLFVMVPNVESLATRLMREMSPTFAWKHVAHFCQNSLELVMAMHNLDCVHLETAITEIDNIKSYMSGEHPYHGYGDPGGLFDFITPQYIHQNLLGSRIIAVFRNVE